MLTELFVKNFALIDEASLEFEPGFTVISGETGAGKSILVGAVDLLLGGKASPVLVRTGESEAILSATFDLSCCLNIQNLLEEAALHHGDELIIRRTISKEGRSRIYINGCQVTLGQLESLTSYLIDLSGQHDQQILLKEENHLSLLDAMTRDQAPEKSVQKLLEEYSPLYQAYGELQKELAHLNQVDRERQQKVDTLRFQFQEIEVAHLLNENEEEELLSEKARVKNADFLCELVQFGEQTLASGEKPVLECLDLLMARLKKAMEMDGSLKEVLELLDSSRIGLNEASHFFSSYGDRLNREPGRLDQIESRLYQIHQLKKKYGESIAVIKQRKEFLEKELCFIETMGATKEEKGRLVHALGEQVIHHAALLSKARSQMATRLKEKVEQELAELSMPKARFEVLLKTPEKPQLTDCGPQGVDPVSFHFSANPGEPPKPLVQIASGGELSRILLAIKKCLGDQRGPITYVFDEIDMGIGGAVAEVVGRKLREISKTSQVLVVTHLPQVASFADHHFVLEKGGDRHVTKTGIRSLSEAKEREDEIARMLGGVNITDKTRAHAKEMIKTANAK